MDNKSVAKNLEALDAAIRWHNSTCEFPLTEIRMNPVEIERLGWDEFMGVPLVSEPSMGTGTFRLVCAHQDEETGDEVVEAVSSSPLIAA